MFVRTYTRMHAWTSVQLCHSSRLNESERLERIFVNIVSVRVAVDQCPFKA